MIAKADILGRLKLASNSTSDADLARFLGIAPATLSNWKSRGSLDYDLVFSKCEQLNLDWLLTGRGNMEKEPDLQQAGIQVQEKFPLKTDNLVDLQRIPFTIWRRRPDWFPVQRCRCDSDQLYIVAGSACMRRGCLRARGFDVSITQKRRYCPLQAGTRHAVRDFLG